MKRLRFAELPLLAQIGVALSFLATWVLIAEFVIDRYGLSGYLPLYRVADVCLWDAAVLVLVVSTVVRLNRT